MQTKTIARVISKKLEEWMATITDDSLVWVLRKNILVSGGSITSMLLDEEVNDFDIYIKDIDVLKRLAEYYTKPFEDIVILDWRTDKSKPSKESKYEVALRTLKQDQIKLYFTEAGWMRVNEDMKEEDMNYTPMFFSPNAISLSDKVQIVLRFHWDNTQIHKTFDFIHATNYFTFEDGLVTNKEALESILTKQLKYQGSLYPITSVIRIKKFLKRGWKISAWEMLKMMFQISELNLKDPDILEEQLIGVDVAYFSALIEALRWVDEDKMNSSYINAIIDRVFNDTDSWEMLWE